MLGLTSHLSDPEFSAFSITHPGTRLFLLQTSSSLNQGPAVSAGGSLTLAIGSGTQWMLIHVCECLPKARQQSGSCC